MLDRVLRRCLRLLWRLVWRGALGFVVLSVALVLLFRFVPPPGSMVMVERKVQSWINSEPIDIQRQWRSWENLSSNAKLAVISAEDQRFPQHRGFDFVEMRRAWEASRDGERLRGASTLSQQTAKNVFLWSGRSWVRKGLEAWFTLLIETLWGKQRILEVYLNVAEWDTGVFGLEAAANHYFGASGSALTERQASLLAAILPNPRNRSASRPDAQVERRSQWIRQQMRNLGGTSFLERL
ncbi:MAG: monofunctional biosynthetic peptidoglycan transglycosylase [Halomonas meridiana]|jgi:monofunctional biosynthetic peptidoglycan transglycosylase|uniref:Biosynthetic peptidoglycan transglycosylase n=1 Tax=Vreelandella aquamarina TaxID=77097 RepID=A0A6F8SXW5_9GAMM|nr:MULTISPECIES: monofunctional biosynthetic peptidoglycan transglycosylase [Halomonas]MEC8900449.1 monofunctional biosynthetic peptidoglycan transglycosylase [Pseudomonadota bacterium]HBS17156.1 monofunctional biosynthetic peptidoglycan transglycosylase [Halomonas sp.]MDK2752078.1 monofunctional biosynthetic peptidoglycan transglycosylase [Halomonas meridiana]MED5557513.1 monofunctional biosynthetic peptidoglycan transglycosylase [Pseudomonadota bacterium]TKJ11210.1 monofunctional biosyntheti